MGPMTDRRYWVTAPAGLSDDPSLDAGLPADDRARLATIDDQLADAGFARELDHDQWVARTRDLDRALRLAAAARLAWSCCDEELLRDCVTVSAQPECPRCGRLARFHDRCCAACAAPLLPRVELDAETGAPRPAR
jgi:hypothetical protein